MDDISSSLITAVREEQIDRARELINTFGLLYSPEWEEGYVLLCDAIKYGRTEITEEIIKLLIINGARINSQHPPETFNTPLHLAVMTCNIEIVKILLDAGADIDTNTENKLTPIFFAAKNSDEKIVKVLLDRGANVNARSVDGKTALHYASINAFVTVTKTYFITTKNGNAKVVKILLDHGANVNAQALDGKTALHYASTYGHVTVVEALLEHNADINCRTENGETPLYNSVSSWYEETTNMLLNKGANVNVQKKNGLTALHKVCKSGNNEFAKLLLKFGAQVNSEDKQNKMLLHIAAHNCYMEDALDTIKTLLRFGADVDSKDKCGRSALHIVAKKDSKKIVETLLKFGAEVDSIDECGRTPLHVASQRGYTKVVVALLKYGSDINIMSKNNCTVFDFAMTGVIEIPKIVDFDNDANSDVSDVELISGHVDCLQILKEHIVKMKSINLYISNENLLRIDNDDEISVFQNKCEKELEDIKKEKVLTSYVSFYDILTKSTNQLALYAKNENILQVLKSEDYKIKFPIYADLVSGRIRNGKRRNWLLERGKTFLNSILKSSSRLPALPLECIEKILSYLDDKDLRILTDSAISNSLINPTIQNSDYIDDLPPLHLAIKNKQVEVVLQLIEYGTDCNTKDKYGKTPIFYSIENTDLEIIKLLLTNGAAIKNPDVLNTTVQKGCREIVEILLQHDVNVNATDRYGRSALHFSTYNHHLSLSNDYFIPNIRGIIELLLYRGANVNAKTKNGETALHHASANGNKTAVEGLLECEADINCRSDTDMAPLHFAVDCQHEEIVQILLNKGAHVNAAQEEGSTALHSASRLGNGRLVELLLKYGANVNSKDKEGTSPLLIAAKINSVDIIKILLRFGINIDCKNKFNETALHIAAKKGDEKVVETLLACNADIDSRDKSDRTPLHVTSQNRCTDVVVALLKHGADINITCKDNCTLISTGMDGVRYDLYDNFDDDIDMNPKTLIILKQHLVKMKIANLYISNENLLTIDRDNETNEFQNECNRELKYMENEKVNDDTVSFYDILTKSSNQLAVYAKNGDIGRILDSDYCREKFPMYADLIKGRFRNGERRKRLLEQGFTILNSLLYRFFHSHNVQDIIEKILSYLCDKDLRILIDDSIKQ